MYNTSRVSTIPVTSVVGKDYQLGKFRKFIHQRHRIRNPPPGCRHIIPLPVIWDADCLTAFHFFSLAKYHTWTRAITLQKCQRARGPVFEWSTSIKPQLGPAFIQRQWLIFTVALRPPGSHYRHYLVDRFSLKYFDWEMMMM